MKNHKRQVSKVIKDVSGEGSVMLKRITEPITAFIDLFGKKKPEKPQRLITYSGSGNQQEGKTQRVDPLELTDTYTSPLANARPNGELSQCR